jgi:hypothetical protein
MIGVLKVVFVARSLMRLAAGAAAKRRTFPSPRLPEFYITHFWCIATEDIALHK